jgi:Na+-driven multidrug efflux pump
MSHTDLTQGSIIRQLVKYSIPLVLSSLLQSLYGMVDMLVVGHYIGATGLSAVNNSSQVMLMITNVLIGICTGGNILIGQSWRIKRAPAGRARYSGGDSSGLYPVRQCRRW